MEKKQIILRTCDCGGNSVRVYVFGGCGGGGGGGGREGSGGSVRKPSLQYLNFGCQISFSYVSVSFPSSFWLFEMNDTIKSWENAILGILFISSVICQYLRKMRYGLCLFISGYIKLSLMESCFNFIKNEPTYETLL